MKITAREIDTSLIEKIERLDGITVNFSEADKSGFVAYNGKEFSIKRVNDIFLNEIYNNSDFDYLNNHLYTETEFTKNSFNSTFNINNVASKNIPNQLVEVDGIPVFQAQGKIRKIRKYESHMLVLDEEGIFYKYNFKEHRLDFTLHLVDRLRKLFSVEKIEASHFLNFEIYGTGFLVSTLYNGVYFADIANNNIEVKFAEQNVSDIEDMKNGNVMLGHTDGTISIFNFKSGMKVETLNYLKKSNQTFKSMFVDNNNLFILGKATYSNSTDNLLHVWNIDPSGSMNNITGLVHKGYDNLAYQLIDISGDNKNIYVAGIKNGKNLFVWKYDRSNLDTIFEETVFDIEVDYINFLDIDSNRIFFNSGNELFSVNYLGKIEKHLKLKNDKKISKFYTKEKDKELLIVVDNYITLYRLPEYKQTEDILLEIFKYDSSSNNVDILIKSDKELTNVVFLNGEGAVVIEPFIKVHTKVGTMYKIMNSSAKVIDVRIGNLGGTIIEGIVVRNNHVYSK
jgi:WD40 repeat protein